MYALGIRGATSAVLRSDRRSGRPRKKVGQGGMITAPRICALADCERVFPVPKQAPHKRYCSERHQRIAERRRYRERHTEPATCPNCGASFRRTTTTTRLQVYCRPSCQYEARAAEYAQRPDIRAGIERARATKNPQGGTSSFSLVSNRGQDGD
jgi:hypothetical protein